MAGSGRNLDRHKAKIRLFNINALTVYLSRKAVAVRHAEKQQRILGFLILKLRLKAVLGIRKGRTAVFTQRLALLFQLRRTVCVLVDLAFKALGVLAVKQIIVLIQIAGDRRILFHHIAAQNQRMQYSLRAVVFFYPGKLLLGNVGIKGKAHRNIVFVFVNLKAVAGL